MENLASMCVACKITQSDTALDLADYVALVI